MTATFVKPVHHMQVKLAAKNGCDIRVSDDQTHYILTVIDTKAQLFGKDAAQLLEDFKARRMLMAEYQTLTIRQDLKDLSWSVLKGKKVLATASCLEDAKDLALEELAAIEQKTTKAKPAKVEKPTKARRVSDEDADEDAESDEDHALADEGDEDADEGESKSVVKRKYKKMYRPHHDTNGDGLSDQIRDHVSKENEAGEMRIDPKALKRFAVANGVWKDSYASLNVGMQKMNVRNRLTGLIRAAARDNKTFEINWA